MSIEFSVVAPMHNEEGNAEPLYRAAKEIMDNLAKPHEIIFVNDASSDRTLEILKKLRSADPNFHFVDLEKNVGENWAMLAGVSKTRGKIIITMDGDFQNDPKFIPALLVELAKGYRVVSGWRRKRVGGFFDRILPSVSANFLIYLLSGVRVHDCGCGLRAYRREVLEGKFVPKGFMNRFSPVAFGVKNSEFREIEVEDRMRTYGKSHYGLKRVFIVFNDLLVLPFALRGPRKMLKIFTALFWIFAAGLVFLIYLSLAGTSAKSWQLIFAALAFLAVISIRWNLGRFVSAQNSPAFRIKEFN